MFRKTVILLAAVLGVAACSDDEVAAPESGAIFVIGVENETFRVHTDDDAVIAEARDLIENGHTRNLNGTILRGHGGFNTGYSWHIQSNTLHFADVTIELCDGRPSYVEENVDYYVDTVKAYCPWGVRVLREVTP